MTAFRIWRLFFFCSSNFFLHIALAIPILIFSKVAWILIIEFGRSTVRCWNSQHCSSRSRSSHFRWYCRGIIVGPFIKTNISGLTMHSGFCYLHLRNIKSTSFSFQSIISRVIFPFAWNLLACRRWLSLEWIRLLSIIFCCW